MMRTANPALNAKTFEDVQDIKYLQSMTIQGTVNKTGLLLLILLAGAAYTWSLFLEEKIDSMLLWMIGGAIGGFIVSLVTIFKKEWSPLTAPLYALLEGIFLGAISSMMDAEYPGIVIQAVALTFGTLGCLLVAYKSRLIRPTENFKLGVVAATGGVALIYFLTAVLGIFGIRMPYIHDSGIIGIGFSLLVVGIAALNLVLDFDFIEQGAEHGAPKYMEWYSAFGLMVTLIWLYIELLRLLGKMNQRK